MSIRKATRQDLHHMSCILAEAFMEDELFGVVMHPHRKEYPEDFIAYWERKLTEAWHDAKSHLLVAEEESGKVIALAYWQRQGGPDDDSSTSNTMVNEVDVNANDLPQNRAADPTKLTIFEDTFPLIAHFWSGARASNWYLGIIATHPDFQRRGYGKQLVAWGIRAADEEGVCVSVISGPEKDGFYESFGFVERGRANIGRLKEHNLKGGAIMFREATSQELHVSQ